MNVLPTICVKSVFIPESWPVTSEIFSGQDNEVTSYLWEPVNSDQRGKLLSKLTLKWTQAWAWQSVLCCHLPFNHGTPEHCLPVVSVLFFPSTYWVSGSKKTNLGSKNKWGRVLMNNFLSENSIRVLLIKTLISQTPVTKLRANLAAIPSLQPVWKWFWKAISERSLWREAAQMLRNSSTYDELRIFSIFLCEFSPLERQWSRFGQCQSIKWKSL